jgi:hypothetical protein
MVSRDRREWMVRKLTNGEKDDGAFDLEFWRRAGAEARFRAISEMVTTAEMLKGGDGSTPAPRLDRSILRIIRR